MTPPTIRPVAWVWIVCISVAAVLFIGCGDGAKPTAASSSSSAPTEDAALVDTDFTNVHSMTQVGDHFIANVRGHLDEALVVARSPEGGRYPVGTIIQLFPQEAMVKRAPGFSPSTNDWEFFSLNVSPTGTQITSRGGAEVVNRFGGSCAGCHGAAAPAFDLVCGLDHGCAPLPIGPDLIAALQRADPRPLQ